MSLGDAKLFLVLTILCNIGLSALANHYSRRYQASRHILSKCLGYLRTTEHKEDYVEACRLVGVDPFPKQ